MGVKIKNFAWTPENTQAINDFLETVNVLENGFIVSDGVVGILYKETDDVGMQTKQLVTALSGELAKSQKQFVLQEGLTRSYTAVIAYWEALRGPVEQSVVTVKAELDTYMATYDPTMEKELATLKVQLDEKHQLWQRTPKSGGQKDAVLADWDTINKQIAELQPKYDEYAKTFNAGANEISARLGVVQIKSNEYLVEIQQNSEYLAGAMKDRDNARIFIGTTKQQIADVESGALIVG